MYKNGKWDSPDDGTWKSGRKGGRQGQSHFDKETLQITTNLSRLDDDAAPARGGHQSVPNYETFCLSQCRKPLLAYGTDPERLR